MRSYDIYFSGERIGTAQVETQGLFYRIRCRCRLTGEVPCSITVSCGDNRQDLGLCVRCEEGYGMVCRVPIKKLGEGNLHFSVRPRSKHTLAEQIPVRENEPFRYLAQLSRAYLLRGGRDAAIALKNRSQDQQGSDQSP